MRRRRARRLAGVALAASAGAERWARGSRATREERRRALPGDALVPRPLWEATRAITVRAPRAAVWPWLVQMGYPTLRAGWYVPAWMDRLLFGIRARSADAIRPELQDLRPGDRVPDSPDGVVAFFTVAALDPGEALVLLSRTHPLPLYRDAAFSWAFVLGDAGAGTRLIVRARVDCAPRRPAPLVRGLIRLSFGVGDVLQAGAMLRGIRARAERTAAAAQDAASATARGSTTTGTRPLTSISAETAPASTRRSGP